MAQSAQDRHAAEAALEAATQAANENLDNAGMAVAQAHAAWLAASQTSTTQVFGDAFMGPTVSA